MDFHIARSHKYPKHFFESFIYIIYCCHEGIIFTFLIVAPVSNQYILFGFCILHVIANNNSSKYFKFCWVSHRSIFHAFELAWMRYCDIDECVKSMFFHRNLFSILLSRFPYTIFTIDLNGKILRMRITSYINCVYLENNNKNSLQYGTRNCEWNARNITNATNW